MQIERTMAIRVLAFVATTNLAYGRYGPPRESYRRLTAAALNDLGPEAIFLSNSTNWGRGGGVVFARLTDATLEAGLIGYDDKSAFIYWVEDED
ncbi:hypothetical protein [Phenylobacterium sp.]|uniref:hypothetical protein n=1 Tax=Phenylobacterium sp. TaxID=1871053 RepID=UPI002735AB74|nr:hypothetical protein [Phenylobacterium sp.]